jgi:zinc transporter ZupT|nr:MAG: hypothetical protein KatS3mg041_1731 [Bacteroidota bacterium]
MPVLGIVLGLLLALAVLLGGWMGNRLVRSPEHLPQWLPFSGGLLLGLVFLHLIPEAVEAADVWAGAALLAGFGLQLLLDQVTGGLEHAHPHGGLAPSEGGGLLMGLCLHSFVESWPLGLVDRYPRTAELLFVAILVHKAPMGMMLVHLLQRSGWSPRRLWTATATLALMPILGIVAAALSLRELPESMLGVLLGVSAGIFMYLAVFLLMENLLRGHHLIGARLLTFAGGLGVASVAAFLSH